MIAASRQVRGVADVVLERGLRVLAHARVERNGMSASLARLWIVSCGFVEAGEPVIVTGRRGAGKTTVLNAVSELMRRQGHAVVAARGDVLTKRGGGGRTVEILIVDDWRIPTAKINALSELEALLKLRAGRSTVVAIDAIDEPDGAEWRRLVSSVTHVRVAFNAGSPGQST